MIVFWRKQLYTQHLYIPGVMDYLSAEISTSKQKKFSLVTFVDTPGLVDGDMIYPFDVNSAITWLGRSLQLQLSTAVPTRKAVVFLY